MTSASSERQPALKPVDIVVALQLTISPQVAFAIISDCVGVSHGEAYNSVGRLARSKLTRPEKREVALEKLLSFISTGVPIVFPAVFGPESRGVPTAHSAPQLAPYVTADNDPLVWADAEGTARGTTLIPLFPKAPALFRTNPRLYELLCLVDSIRIGRPRETSIAVSLLADRIAGSKGT